MSTRRKRKSMARRTRKARFVLIPNPPRDTALREKWRRKRQWNDYIAFTPPTYTTGYYLGQYGKDKRIARSKRWRSAEFNPFIDEIDTSYLTEKSIFAHRFVRDIDRDDFAAWNHRARSYIASQMTNAYFLGTPVGEVGYHMGSKAIGHLTSRIMARLRERKAPFLRYGAVPLTLSHLLMMLDTEEQAERMADMLPSYLCDESGCPVSMGAAMFVDEGQMRVRLLYQAYSSSLTRFDDTDPDLLFDLLAAPSRAGEFHDHEGLLPFLASPSLADFLSEAETNAFLRYYDNHTSRTGTPPRPEVSRETPFHTTLRRVRERFGIPGLGAFVCALGNVLPDYDPTNPNWNKESLLTAMERERPDLFARLYSPDGIHYDEVYLHSLNAHSLQRLWVASLLHEDTGLLLLRPATKQEMPEEFMEQGLLLLHSRAHQTFFDSMDAITTIPHRTVEKQAELLLDTRVKS